MKEQTIRSLSLFLLIFLKLIDWMESAGCPPAAAGSELTFLNPTGHNLACKDDANARDRINREREREI